MIASDPNMKKAAEREALRAVIQQWNANRLDLFELSEPNEDLEFYGVMRFYFHDSGQRVATKCIRVSSEATVTAVIETLIEKFRPDMRMLSVPEYALYVTHENRDERRLNPDEKPLLVQLNWHKDDREGRFLLKRIDDKTKVCIYTPSNNSQETSFRRKLSKREKKQLKKQEKLKRMKSNGDADEGSVAEKLYTELPETSFTRSISNPEAVMRRRRQQKLEKKLQQFRSKDGGPDTGGTLKIYGEALCGDVPYKTLLLSVRDTTTHVVKEMLSKYGLDKEDAHNYCLVQVNTGDPLGPSEYILDEDECPLAILMNHPSTSGSIMFHVRRRPADYHPRKRKKKPQQKWQRGDLDSRYDDGLPYFLELNPDGSEIMSGTPKRHVLHPNVTEVGSERMGGPNLQLFGPNIQPRHCVIAHTDGLVTVTPCSREAETFVNGQRIYETTILQNGAIVKFGRIHNFRFIDPGSEDRGRARQPDFAYDRLSKDDNNSTTTAHNSNNLSNYETTFDVDGNVETVSLKDMDSRSQRSIASSRDGNRLSNYERYPRGNDPILPAVLEVREDTEEAFLHAVIIDLDPTVPSFKLAPTYTLYLTARYRASTHYRPELTPPERAHRLTVMLARVASMIQHVVQERYSDTKSLAFWMANASELLHFLKCDRHVSAFSLDAQDILAECVQIAFRHLVSCHQGELTTAMTHFLSERDDSPNTVLQVLSSAMALLRRCRVNAALTIQLFSQLFHFVNMMAFNKIVTSPSQPQGINYCSRAWGIRLKDRVTQLGAWAERQGLELAANCHLGRLAEAAYLLEAPKYNANELAQLSTSCLKLNSLQLRALLRGYQPQPDEPKLPLELIDNVVHVAENVADELARSDGREVKLEEDVELQLPFLLPEDGYSCDVVRGVPQGLTEFIQPLQIGGLCRMNVQPTSSGQWTIYMSETNTSLRSPSAMSNRLPANQQQLDIQTIRLHKSNNGMGLSIVAAKGAGQDRLGIYIKSVVAGGAADVDGRLQAGDQLLKVDGQSLVGITQEKAAEHLVRTGPVVTLEVAKQGAIYHGLATLLSQPSPLMSRANKGQARRNSEYFDRQPQVAMPSSVSMMNLQTRQGELPGPRRMSERDLPSRLHGEDAKKQLPPHVPIQSSKSVPSLHTGTQGAEPRPQEVFNPGYSRTSSTNSIPQSALRSRSNQNLSDARGPNRAEFGAPVAPQSAPLHPTQSTPSLHQSQHYHSQLGNSNQSMLYNSNNSGYQHDNVISPSSYQGPGNTPVGNSYTPGSASYSQMSNSYQGTPQNNQYTPGNSPYVGSPQSNQGPMSPGGVHYSGTPQNNSYQGPPNSNQYLASPQGNQYPQSPVNNQYQGPPPGSQYPGSPAQNHVYPGNPANYHYPGPGPSSGNQYQGPPTVNTAIQYPGSPGGYNSASGQQQMEHERFYQNLCVYRSQDGFNKKLSPDDRNLNNPPLVHRSPGSDVPRDRPASAYLSPHSMPLQNAAIQNRSQSSRDVFRQEAKLHEMTEEVRRRELRGAPASRPNVSFGPPPVAPKPSISEEYRESPPPPPPPANTHPLLQKTSSPDNRYQASLSDPPRGGYYPASPGDRRQYPYTGTNPWEREEKEKEQARRREAARQWREQQINELSSLQSRTPQQEEQLRALKLERDFERRAEEAKQEDEEEGEEEPAVTESSERVQGLLRMAQQQNGPIIRPATGSIAQMKLEEVRRQHAQGQNLNLKLSPSKPASVNDLRFENLSINGPSQYNGYYHEKTNGNVPHSPDRGSYQSSGGVLKSPVQPQMQPPKRVSFSDPNPSSNMNNNNNNNNNNSAPMEKIIEDPNNFINEAENMLNSPKTPEGTPSYTANTPGVIGAQEVYRDPRQRLLAEQKQNSIPKVPGPEKLSFKEKMKMFAMETGEDGTPRDKVKISRAQRDIDNISSPLNNNNNNNNNNN